MKLTSILADRLGDLDPTPRQRALTMLCSVLGVLLIGAVDYRTGTEFSFAILYLLPVVLTAVVVGTGPGCWLSLLASVTWVVAEDHVFRNDNLVASLWNGFGRFATMCVVVVLLGALRETVVRLSGSERSSREFLATAAHQLRTPIAGLIASAEALSSETDPATRSRLTDNLVAGTNRTRRLLTSLLEMSRLDHAVSQERRSADLASVCRREVSSFQLAQQAVTVRYEGPDSLPMDTNGDAVREAVTNLLDNAVRHAASQVTVRLTGDGTQTSILVSDDGPGLPAGSEARVFERFVSLDGAGGAGLGLPIAVASIRSVDGTLEYRQRTFEIRLPAATAT